MKKDNLILFGIVMGIGAIAYFNASTKKHEHEIDKKVEERLREKKIEEVAKAIDVEVEPEVIGEAVEKVVREEVTK